MSALAMMQSPKPQSPKPQRRKPQSPKPQSPNLVVRMWQCVAVRVFAAKQ